MANEDYEKKKQRLAELDAQMRAIAQDWIEQAGDGKNKRDIDIERAIEWSREGVGDVTNWGEVAGFLSGSEESQRKNFRDIKLRNGKKRSEVMKEYAKLKEEADGLKASVGAAVEKDPNKVVTDDQGKVIGQRNMQTGQYEGLNLMSQISGAASQLGQLSRNLTDADLESIWRTQNPDITPQTIADLYPEYDAEGHRINQLNPTAWDSAPLVNWESNPQMQGANREAYMAEMRRTLSAPYARATTSAHGTERSAEKRNSNVSGPGSAAIADKFMSDSERDAQSRADVLSPAKQTYSFREAFALPYSWSKSQVQQMATKLFQAGYMPQLLQNFDPERPLSEQYPGSLGDPHNMLFRNAYMAWMQDAQTDRSKTAMQILDERVGTTGEYFSEMKRVLDEKKAKERAEKLAHYTNLSDPDTINQLGDQMGQAILGRKLTMDEKAQLIGNIHSLQTNYGQAKANDEQIEDVDVGASVSAMIEGKNPVEAGAKDVADQYDEFRKLLGGPLGMGL